LTRIANDIESAVRDLHSFARETKSIPRAKCPGPVSQIAEQVESVASRRGLQGEVHIFEGRVGPREVWIFELTVFTPDPSEQKKLRNWR